MANLFEEMAADKDPLCLYIVVRESVKEKMSDGKFGAQVGHAVDKVVLTYSDMFINFICSNNPPEGEVSVSDFGDVLPKFSKEDTYKLLLFSKWRNRGHRKVLLVADEKEWAALKDEFGDAAFIVVDAGLTEIDPGTETIMSFWPQYKSSRTKSMKRLRPLK